MPILASIGAGSARGFGEGAGVSVSAEFDYLVIAGGGAAFGSIAGGGGAGGYRTSFPGGTKIELSGGDTITVGAGGARTITSPTQAGILAGKGVDSVAGDITSAGGGTQNGDTAYGAPNASPENYAVRSGGSGAGGGHQYSWPVGAGNVPPTSPPQGAAGTANTGGGGGGGSGDSPSPGPTNNGGSGIVVLRLPTSDAPAGIGASPGSNTVSTSGSDTIVTFNVTGTLEL